MRKIIDIFMDKTGGMIIWSAGFVLLFCIFAAAAMEFYKAYTIAAAAEEMVRKATVTMAVDNTYNAHSALRDAKHNAYDTDGQGHWSGTAVTDDVIRQMRKIYAFQSSGGKLVHSTSAGTEFTLDVKDIRCNNKLSSNGELDFFVTYELEIPLRFMREIHVTVPIVNQTHVSFTPLY